VNKQLLSQRQALWSAVTTAEFKDTSEEIAKWSGSRNVATVAENWGTSQSVVLKSSGALKG
jgi:hypothetical protein